MKKVKALIAMVALVAVIAVASVAQAATVDVSGTVATSVTLNNCTVSLGTIPTSTTVANATCTPTYDVNSANGYTIDYLNTSAVLTNTTTSDTIATVVENGVAGGAATTCSAASECWSYNVASDDTGVVYGDDDSTESPPGQGDGVSGWSDWNTGEHGIYVGTDGIITDGTSGYQTGYTLTMTYYAAATSTTDAGTFQNNTGTLTLTAL